MIGGKRRGSVVPPPPPSTAKDGGDVVGGKRAVVAENENALPPGHESAVGEGKKVHKTPAKAAVNGDDSSGSDDEESEEGEEEEEDEEEEEGSEDNDSEIEDGEADGDAGDDESTEKPKLAEGFYYIEAVRKKRFRKGKREYRIKWQGWPESANTWEPMENLKTVPHVIANYEASLKAKRRKRKRRNSSSFSQPRRKKRKRSAAVAPAVKRTVPAAPELIVEETLPAVAAETDNVVESSGVFNDNNGIIDLEAGEESNENGVDLTPSVNEETEAENNDVIMTSDKEKSPVEEQSQVKPQEAQLTGGNAVANGSEKTESGEEALLQAGGRSTGSRRRKSGPVRRFKLEPNSAGADDLENAALDGSCSGGLGENQLPENPDLTSKDVGCKDTRDTRKNICDIIEIIKPIKYTSFMTCDTLDVCVTFLVKRSDGKEMTVDNKFLKAHCPVLLLDFYEQRLRY